MQFFAHPGVAAVNFAGGMVVFSFLILMSLSLLRRSGGGFMR